MENKYNEMIRLRDLRNAIELIIYSKTINNDEFNQILNDELYNIDNKLREIFNR